MIQIRSIVLLFALLLARRVAPAAEIVLVAGGSESAVSIPATRAKLDGPFGVDFNRAGTMFIVEMTGQRVLTVDPAGRLQAFAGTGAKGNAGDGGAAQAATFNGMHALLVGPNDDVYLADTWNNRIRKIAAGQSAVENFAGTGVKGFSGDGGPAAQAQFGGVYCLALAPAGDRMYVADLDNRRIRTIDLTTGLVSTLAGNGKSGVPADGSDALTSPLVDPRAVAADATGNVYILERKGNALRVVDKQGKIRTLFGPGVDGVRDEQNRPAAPLNGPKHLCIDLDGDVLICDTESHLIRKFIAADKRLVRVAGTGKAGAAGLGGSPLSAELKQPHGVFAHPAGAIYIADSSNDRVLKIIP